VRHVAPRIWAWALLGVLVLLTPLAYCTPPDPVWINGVFDDDDNDNGVFLVTSSAAALDPFPLAGWSLFRVAWPTLAAPGSDPDPVRSFSAVDVRAPPAS
jgi:hypothetical protein